MEGKAASGMERNFCGKQSVFFMWGVNNKVEFELMCLRLRNLHNEISELVMDVQKKGS